MSNLQVLRTKGANKPVNHKVKIPADLAKRLEDLDKRVQEHGLEVDWDTPLVDTLTNLADAVERDLATAAAANAGQAGGAAGGEQSPPAANASGAEAA
ncbi:hypothetical protein [Cupriavidus sp. TMH.W2]|uniref:hypothetical protein n=1 Tax=Cupriavidus sp. TMH.W2 TaxID=3434465 RepID=UPI003D76DD8D